ncbi:MAG: universal stress protein [Dehalogenimonas sp.]|uniref:Universal stress protein n=1 Tax=Candidatus Dehalogenimonas loeffleri TaxID=3127115 RepID=A0ABZ2J2T2_9CHLR|nr:universal stress protein [Dehalogenimonas sp.]
MFRRILVPLDGSTLAEVALPCAEEMAGRMGSQVILVSVLESGADQYENLFRCYLNSRAADLQTRILDGGGPDVTVTPLLVPEIEEEDLIEEDTPSKDLGHPTSEIIGAAAAHGASIIIMATHGYSGLRRVALSSVADAIVHGCGMPVLLVRPDGEAAKTPSQICRNIVVPLDGSAMAESALRVVEDMAAKMSGQGMTVNLVHVAPERRVATTDEPSQTFLENVVDPAWCKAGDKAELYFEQAAAYLKQSGATLEAAGVTVNHQVRAGKPEEEIAAYTTDTCAAMIVMACHARTGIGRYLMGSTADRILRTVEASVLLLRPEKPQPPGTE